jgi:hypothetical protein
MCQQRRRINNWQQCGHQSEFTELFEMGNCGKCGLVTHPSITEQYSFFQPCADCIRAGKYIMPRNMPGQWIINSMWWNRELGVAPPKKK